MNKVLKKIYILSTLTLGLILLLPVQSVDATYNQNKLIDTAVFNNSGSMSAGQIDAFLNQFPNSCISPNKGFTSPNPIGYNPSQGYLFGSNVTAGQVIASASQVYGLNPQVILATLQKEQSLITGGAGCYYGTPPTLTPCPQPLYGNPNASCVTACQYAGGCVYIALGYDCPYYCDTDSLGFSKQVIKATWMLKFSQERSEGNVNWNVQKPGWDNSDDPPTNYSGNMTQGWHKRIYTQSTPTYFDGYANVNGTTIHMDNGATVALYRYTPFLNGGISFVNNFEQWFGSTTGPFYSFISAVNPPQNMSYGSIAEVELKVRNGSSMVWYSDVNLPNGIRPFRIMMKGYQNTAFADTSDPSWLGTKNQIRLLEQKVNPGEVATFKFRLKAPQYSINNEILNMVLVQDGVQVYSDLGLQFRVNSVPDLAYTVISTDHPVGILPGDMYLIKIRLKNTGSETWYSDSALPINRRPVRIATPYYKNSPYAQPRTDPSWLGTKNQIRLLESSVAPGQIGTFQAVFTAPYKATSNYVHDFSLVLDGVKFVHGPLIQLKLSTPSPVATYSFVGAINPPLNMKPNQLATGQVKIRNTGNMIWRNFDHKILDVSGGKIELGDTRLLVANPVYKDSPFSPLTYSWLGTKNQVRMKEAIVPPGQVGTFDMDWRAPSITGAYLEYFTFGIDGTLIMPSIGLAFPSKVNL